MERLLFNDKVYSYHEYKLEKEFEKDIILNSKQIFGSNSVYIDIKKRIGDNIVTIPDAYLIDFSFKADPRLYIIENELSSHDPYKHIGSQILKFAISYKASGRKIKKFLYDNLTQNKDIQKTVQKGFKKANYRNIDAFLDSIIFDKPVSAIVIIDKSTSELENVLSQLTLDTDIIEFQTFISNNEKIHKFTPFNVEIRDFTEKKISTIPLEDLNTIVVPAQDEGFQSAFIKSNAWWAIRISASMISRIKYIAAYQAAPISAITHYAEVSKIEKYKDTNKYILYFKEPAKSISPIKLGTKKKGTAPQAPRYTSIKRLLNAKTFEEVF